LFHLTAEFMLDMLLMYCRIEWQHARKETTVTS